MKLGERVVGRARSRPLLLRALLAAAALGALVGAASPAQAGGTHFVLQRVYASRMNMRMRSASSAPNGYSC